MTNQVASQFEQQGFAILEEVITATECDALSVELESVFPSKSKAGRRNLFLRSSAICQLVRQPLIRSIVEPILGKDAFAVRGILFDKTPKANWNVAWHQDTFISVKQRLDIAGYNAWSEKEGVPHVKPPVEVLASMVTLRLHLDSCDLDNGPLRVVPASHTSGILSSAAIGRLVEKSNEEVCTVGRGSCVLMSPLLVHASSRARHPTRRRVVHLEFANCELASSLQWYGGC